MARIFPEKPNGNISPEVARAFRSLKALPDDWVVWFHLTPWEPEAPDFLILDPEERALLLKVSGATPQQAQQAPQLQLLAFEQEDVVPGEAEERILATFIGQADRVGVPRSRISAAVLFPNLEARDLHAIEESGTNANFEWLDKSWVNAHSAADWQTLVAPQPLDQDMLRELRGQFTPETVIPSTFVARTRPRARALEAGITEYLLDYDQENILKQDLDLAAEGDALAREMRIQVINGVAGSGKTLILLYRLRLLQALFPQKRYLVLTHNRPLIRDMRFRYTALAGAQTDVIQWNTFMGWCRKNWPDEQSFSVIRSSDRERLLRNVWHTHLRETSLTADMFTSEVDWIKDNGIATREAYLEADRRGRGFRLNESQREQCFHAALAYQQQLQKRQELDWGDVPRRYWHWMEQGALEPPHYDVVLVDEAQFFAPIWFNIVRRLIPEETGYLFLAADPTQGFLRRGDSWKSITGLEVRGRSHHLRRSYRTTRAILTCAFAFYRQRLPEEEAELLLPDLSGMQKGKPPHLLRFTAAQDERARIVSEITRAVAQGLPKRHIMVLHASWKGVEALIEALNQELGAGAARDPKDELPGEFIRVATLTAATGLESPVVFVSGIHELFEKEESLRLTEDERAELLQKHTRQLYMAFTRAGQHLVITHVGDALPHSLAELQKYDLLDIA